MSFQNSQVLTRLKPFGISFEKSLSDLIKGIRSHSKQSPEALAEFLDTSIQECKNELITTDLETKAMSILKLAYLEMYGFDMTWCNFHILEIMSSGKFQQKRIGYLAAIQSFKNEQDLLILATNQFKKDLNSSNSIEIGLALSGIATIVTPALAQDINDDVVMKLSHSKPYIRKKAVLAMYKIFLQYPESLRSNFEKIIEKLDDEDTSVISATINVICELSKKNPTMFINYLPKLFAILEDTNNNWLIIRILKLFQTLSRVEPRMKRKILPTIMELMNKTQASSLIYECINCIVNGQMLTDSYKDQEIAQMCIDKLMVFFKTNDSNLKFVGLLALIQILKIYPVLIVNDVSQVIMDCLVDPDIIIKQKALTICQYLINEDNITEVVKLLLLQLQSLTIPTQFQFEIVVKLLEITTSENYSNIPNFKWYVAVLKDVINLTLLQQTHPDIASEIGREFKNLATKVPSIRPILVEDILVFIQDVRIIENCPVLLVDFYWIIGEYIDEINNLSKKINLFNNLVNTSIDKQLSTRYFPISAKLLNVDPQVTSSIIQALVKLFNNLTEEYIKLYSGELPQDKYNELGYYLFKLIGFLSNWETNEYYEVQERVLSWLEFLKLSFEALGVDDEEIKRLEEKEVEHYRERERSERDIEPSESESESEQSESEGESDSDEEIESEEEEVHEEVAPPAAPLPEFESNPFAQAKKLPVLLTTILPSFFKSYQLNPISRNAQRNIPYPEDITESTFTLNVDTEDGYIDDDYNLYMSEPEPLIELTSEETFEKKKKQRERLNDPYYISSDTTSERKSPSERKSLKSETTPEVDLVNTTTSSSTKKPKKLKKEKVVILSEETIEGTPTSTSPIKPKTKKKKTTLKIDSSNLDNFNLNVAPPTIPAKEEYEIDLESYRNKLAESSASDKPKKKKSSTKTKKKKSKAIILD
ncbi:AP-3 complex subunit delta [Spathaspora sp. JA1]|nr:AP-3 complex subunit delta [Spathaspora sp. JA1]